MQMEASPDKEASFIHFIGLEEAGSQVFKDHLTSAAAQQIYSYRNLDDYLGRSHLQAGDCVLVFANGQKETLQSLKSLLSADNTTRIIVISKSTSLVSAVASIKAGAVNFITWPCDIGDVIAAIEEARCGSSQAPSAQHRPPRSHPRARLTRRQEQVLELVMAGCRNWEIAEQLGVCERSIEGIRSRIKQRLGAKSVAEMIRMAM